VATELRSYVRGLDLDAYVVGGSVRDELLGLPQHDEDFLVPGVDHAGLRDALSPHGRIEDLEVHGQLVGVRLHPSHRAARALAPKGIEFTPARVERSTGPAHKDFAIVADGTVTIEADMARRDFTVNAMARRLADGELVDPFGGRADLEHRVLRTVAPESFADDPLRILRGLRLVSQLRFTLADETRAQMERNAAGLAHVSPERIGGGIKADGMGELSRLLHGTAPATALALMRDTGALVVVLPELAAMIGYRTTSTRQVGSVEEHTFAVVHNLVGTGADTTVRLAALMHDAAKPEAAATGGSHSALGAKLAAGALRRLRYPVAVIRDVRTIIAAHGFALEPWQEGADAALATRRFLAGSGERIARSIILLKRADLAAKTVPDWEKAALARLAELLEEAVHDPYRLGDLAVDGADLIASGLAEGPALGGVLAGLLSRVVDDPTLNTREQLLALAGELSP